MPIPNVSSLYSRINHGSEGGSEFSRIMNLLLKSEFKERNLKFISFSDAMGDFHGLDSYIVKENKVVQGFQYKFYSKNLTANQKYNIKKGLEKACKELPYLSIWNLILPEDLMLNNLKWVEELKEEFEYSISFMEYYKNKNIRNGFNIRVWGHTDIIDLILRHPNIGNKYYPELFLNSEANEDKPYLAKITVDNALSNWIKSMEYKDMFEQYKLKKVNATSDLVFDIYFINNTKKLFLLHQINIKIIKVWTDLKGIKSKQLLKSLGNIDIDIDFDKETNEKILTDPIIFKKSSPVRFKIQLLDFVNKCPGNYCILQIEFLFSNFSLESNQLLISI